MKKSGEKDIFKTLSLVLAVLIIVSVIGGIALLLFAGGGGQKRSNEHERANFKAIVPTDKYEQKDHIAIRSNGESSSAVMEEMAAGDYIIPESSTRILTNADVEGMSADQLRYARNEIYARHGRMFKDAALQQYFSSKSWYEPTISADSFSEGLLSETEKRNIDFLKSVENSR